jgi:hypothetical protein
MLTQTWCAIMIGGKDAKDGKRVRCGNKIRKGVDEDEDKKDEDKNE